MNNLGKILTIWIPTYRRPRQLSQLLENAIQTRIVDIAKIVISDNDPEGALSKAGMIGEANLPDNIS